MIKLFLIDWLSFSAKHHGTASLIESMGLTKIEFTITNGFYGYRDSLYFDGIRIHYNPRSDDMGILLEMSGKGCRAFEEYSTRSWDELFNFILDDGFNVTRLDIAFDDKEGIIPIRKLGSDVEAQNYTSKWQAWKVINSSDGYTVELGSMSSDIFFRIYDKAAEQGVDGHWVRLELQLRNERASEFLKQMQTTELGTLYCGVLNNYVRFLKPSKTDAHKYRWSTAVYWRKFITTAEKISIWTSVGTEYTPAHLHNFVVNQAGGAVNTYVKLYGTEKLVDELINRKVKLNPKYETLLANEKLRLGDKSL